MIIREDIDLYCEKHTSSESDLLALLNRETHAKILQARMLSGHFQGRFLSMISKIFRPKNILEIGTYTGYSALCLAEGLPQDGKLITIDVNEELEDFVRDFFAQSAFAQQIDFRIANALELIPKLTETFDLVFIDADKRNYSNYYDLIFDKVPSGGIILADNVLWDGKVSLEKHQDKDTQILRAFNEKVMSDDRVENILLPIRDGLMCIRKK
jgi:predicted O-methyltransferase YrrM